jgi:4-amino-4-deoxy-L-arabinose transferase-like glycosyltransferase
MPFIADEPIRAIVSYEMYLRHAWFAPSINGEAYLNKPPLFNLWICAWIHVLGGLNEFTLRIQSVFFLFLCSITIYIYGYRYFRWKVALLSAIGFLTCSRILFYDSTLGYIDPFFTWIILLQLLGATQFYLKENWILFYLTITLTSLIAYFLKGLPGIAFGGITFLSLLLWERKWKMLWNPYLFISILFSTSILIVYYLKINSHNLADSSTQIVDQSIQRYGSTNVFYTLIHMLTFPLQFIVHFSPWGILWLYLGIQYKNLISGLNRHQWALMIVCTSNLLLYWISTETRPRYLFMFVGIYFLLGYSIYFHQFYSAFWNKVLHRGLFWIAPLFFILPVFYWFLDRFHGNPNYLFNGIIITTAAFSAAILIYIYHKWSVWTITFILLIFLKIILQGMFLPLRVHESPESKNKTWGYEIASIAQKNPIQITQYTPINADISFYIIQKTKVPMQMVSIDAISSEYVLTSNLKDLTLPFRLIKTYPLSYDNYKMYFVKIEKC